MARNDLGQNFLPHETPRPIAHCAFFVGEKLFDAVIIQRACRHVVSVPLMRDSLAGPQRENNAAGQSICRTKGAWHKRLYNYFAVDKPAAFQALKPPAMERTFL